MIFKNHIRLIMILLSLVFLYRPVIAQEEEAFLFYLNFDNVYTPSKADQKIEQSTSIITVITEDEIRHSGARTVYELLKRVPGFFPSSQATWPLISSRGLNADGNDHFLLLIDGHVQNSIVGQGFQQQDMLPVLEKVFKIEIIRGPGSVLWGSNAVLGIINIITKINNKFGSQINTAYGDADGMFSGNYIYSFCDEKISGFVSLSYWESDGYDSPDKTEHGAAWEDSSIEEKKSIRSNMEFPWGKVGDWPPIDKHHEGYELYTKWVIGETELLGRIAKSSVVYPWDTWLGNPGSQLDMRKAYLSFRRHVELNDLVSLDTVIFGDMLLQNRFPYYKELYKQGGGENRTHIQDQSNEELAFGIEFTGKIDVTEMNRLMLGLKAVRTSIGPNRDSRFNIASNTASSVDYPYLGVESGYDNNIALYFEDSHALWDQKTSFFFGGRYDYNDFREKKAVFLPRFGAIYSFDNDLTLKYIFNTGYLRPNAVYSKSSGIIVDTIRGPEQNLLVVDKSEKLESHDIQFFWKKKLQYAAATFFLMKIKDYISFDANNVPQGYKNLGDIKTWGLELETKYQISDYVNLYANYSYARAKLEETVHQGALSNLDNETLNYPKHIFNIGTDLRWTEKHILNINLNGWKDMNVMLPLGEWSYNGEFGELDGEMYLDITYNYYGKTYLPFDFSLFVINVFDNTDPVGMIVNNGVWHPRGRNIGTKITYSF